MSGACFAALFTNSTFEYFFLLFLVFLFPFSHGFLFSHSLSFFCLFHILFFVCVDTTENPKHFGTVEEATKYILDTRKKYWEECGYDPATDRAHASFEDFGAILTKIDLGTYKSSRVEWEPE